MADDFFKSGEDDAKEDEGKNEEPETIKVGEKEYTQDELQKVVGLGEIGTELEEKWNTKIDRLYPEYTKKTQELSELPDKLREEIRQEVLKEVEEKNLEEKKEGGKELSEEEQRKIAEETLNEMGFVKKDVLKEEVMNILSARDLLDETQSVIDEAASNELPKVSQEELLNYMRENGVKRPEAAYKLMFEKELEEIQAKRLKGVKGEEFVTEDGGSAAGSKAAPAPKKITRDNLGSALREVMNRES